MEINATVVTVKDTITGKEEVSFAYEIPDGVDFMDFAEELQKQGLI